MNLNRRHCQPCEGGTPPLSASETKEFIKEVSSWTIVGDKKLEKTLTFKDFQKALNFVNKVGVIAEAEGHHPDIAIFDYKKVRIELYTHAIEGLSENDFILAAKINEI